MMKNYSEITDSLSKDEEIISKKMEKQKKLLSEMTAADIAGYSGVDIKDGKIASVWVEGTVNSTRCGFLKMTTRPTAEDQKYFHKSYYILTNDALYYFNKSKQSLENISLDESSFKRMQDKFKDNVDILSEEQLKNIELITNHEHLSPSDKITDKTVFAAASLSKPVFAYLVLKLIQVDMENKSKTDKGIFNAKFDLDTPLYEALPDKKNELPNQKTKQEWLAKFADQEKAKKLTARMVLSHTTGLPVKYDGKDPIPFLFEPGTKYGYSGPGIAYLQEVVETVTDSDLETLAQQYVFHQEGFEMSNSSFATDKTRDPQAANSLYTTPSDYANFLLMWMNDKKLLDLFDPFKPVEFVKNCQLEDNWPILANVNPEHKEQVAWCLGMGVQTDKQGNPIRLYHTGDMGEWRTFFAVNLENKSAVVYFANSHNGYILVDKLVPGDFKMEPVYDFFFNTYGFAQSLQDLHGVTNMHGINPTLIKPQQEQQAVQIETKSESKQELESSQENKAMR